jgi:hypothetical protein
MYNFTDKQKHDYVVDLLTMDLSDVETREIEKKFFLTGDKLRDGKRYKQNLIEVIRLVLMFHALDILTFEEIRYYTSKLRYFSIICLYDKLVCLTSLYDKGEKLK